MVKKFHMRIFVFCGDQKLQGCSVFDGDLFDFCTKHVRVNYVNKIECVIMAYKPEVLDHYRNPRHVGTLPAGPDVGVSMVGAPACGDVMRVHIRVQDGVITQAVFKAFGCGAAIASASWAVDQLAGKTLDQAVAMKNTEIAAALSLPPVKLHCSMLAEDAIKGAVEDYRQKQENARTLGTS